MKALREIKHVDGKPMAAEKKRLIQLVQNSSQYLFLDRVKPHLADLLMTFTEVNPKLSPQDHEYIIRLFLSLKEQGLYEDKVIKKCVLFEPCKPVNSYQSLEFARSTQLLDEIALLRKTDAFAQAAVREAMLSELRG